MVDNQAQYDGISSVFRHESYLVRRKVFRILGGSFHIYDPSGNVAFYSEQKAFKLKEDIRLYSGEDKARELLHIQARDILDFSAAYDVIDSSTGMKVGTLRRHNNECSRKGNRGHSRGKLASCTDSSFPTQPDSTNILRNSERRTGLLFQTKLQSFRGKDKPGLFNG